MDEKQGKALKIYFNEELSYGFWVSFLTSSFSMPDTQADQIYIILKNNNELILFNGLSDGELEDKKNILEENGIECKVVSYDK
jgi:hypothetical protein